MNHQEPRELLNGFIAALCIAGAILLAGCGATVTVNILSSHSRYGQAVGGTNTQIRGQIEGGGSASATVPMTP